MYLLTDSSMLPTNTCGRLFFASEQILAENQHMFAVLHVLNEEREISGRQEVVHESNVPVLTSYAGLNPRSKSGYEREARVIKKIQKKYPKFFLFFKLFSILILLIENQQKIL